MDRILKALDRAGHGADLRDRPEKTIVYTETQQCRLNPGVLRRGRLLGGSDDARVIDCYRLLRTRLLHRMRQNNWRTLGVTSAAPQEGKTLTSINLALSIALEPEHTALIVDADLRRPSVHSVFGLQPMAGLSDYLLTGEPLKSILINPGIERFVILPGRRLAGVGSEHLAGASMERLIKELRSRYADRIVVFDLPPVLVGDDVVAIAPRLDALLVVAEEGETLVDELHSAMQLLDGVPIIGTVLNKSTEVSRGYDYYY